MILLKKDKSDKIKTTLVKNSYRINQQIKAKEIRVIDEENKQIGVFPVEKAIQLAKERGLDLVEVAPKANPPVCRIIDFKKFKFLESKKKQREKKKSKKIEIKEVQLSPFIAENDFNFRIGRAEKFLKGGNKVKISVIFKGRQITKKDFGYQLIEKTLERLRNISEVDFEPKFVGQKLEMTLRPLKGIKND